jgi:preprotein translocase subunit SecG
MWLTFFMGLLTAVLVLDCLFLLLLILIQLPKKEAGLGQAFGSSTTDALFGAGSGTALTKMTKYGAIVFFVLTFLLAILNASQSKAKRTSNLGALLKQGAAAEQKAAATVPAASNAPVMPMDSIIKLTNALPPVVPNKPATNAASATAPVTGAVKPVTNAEAGAPATNKPAPSAPK